ncbi:MAG TPA: peptidylprolyl isomerase [Bacteroidales bacterium]|nr:peptidylprolyl isomerase [Bacteroidales bacterium]HQI46057.1 peptidylprolyl isomerase [Bacteroidales bacterium]
MKRNYISFSVFFICLFMITQIMAQTSTDPVLVNISGDKITKSEFLNVYNKNNLKNDVIDKKSLEEYLDLYINFKLKVKEAESLGMDTVSSFITELDGYREQLAQPYLVDKEVNEELLQEAYNRMQQDVRASHILIRISPNASPADTLKAYQKIMNIRNRIVNNKEDFGKVAAETSDDQYAKDQPATETKAATKGNKGELGYFTALDLIYSFETAAYTTNIGSVSMPIRTDYGYHLIYVTDKKPAMGRVQVSHIIVTLFPSSTAADSAKAKAKIFEISDSIKAGVSFEEMARKFSDDKTSAVKGGVIPMFGVNRMVPEFITAIAKLKKVGDVSEPVQTAYGWHVIKLLEHQPIEPLDSIKSSLKTRISKDTRANKSKESMVAKVKKEYGFKEFPASLSEFHKVVNDSIFTGVWDKEKAKNLNNVMFSFGSKSYTQQDFADYFEKQISMGLKEDSAAYVNRIYKQYIEDCALQFENDNLESKYPEFKALMKEYRDGILLFSLTDEKVWSKAVKDTIGLKSFYEENKEKYMWEDRVQATIYSCSNLVIANKAQKLVKKGKLTDEEITKLLNKDSQLNLSVESGKYQKNDNAIIDSIPWVKGITPNINTKGSVVFVKISQLIPKQAKTLVEARGLITADYQNYLEEKWLEELKAKYTVEINKEVLSSIE